MRNDLLPFIPFSLELLLSFSLLCVLWLLGASQQDKPLHMCSAAQEKTPRAAWGDNVGVRCLGGPRREDSQRAGPWCSRGSMCPGMGAEQDWESSHLFPLQLHTYSLRLHLCPTSPMGRAQLTPYIGVRPW